MKLDRKKLAEVIINNFGKFKVCLICESIIYRNAQVCVMCSGYRFSEDKQEIIKQAKELGDRDRTSVSREDLI